MYQSILKKCVVSSNSLLRAYIININKFLEFLLKKCYYIFQTDFLPISVHIE